MEHINFWEFRYTRKFIKWLCGFVSELWSYADGKDFDIRELPKNGSYKNKRGRKKKSELDGITEEMLEANEISIDSIKGGIVKMYEEEEGVFGWDKVDVRMLVRDGELTEEDKEEILNYKNEKGEFLFKEKHLPFARKVKKEWAKGDGRDKIKATFKGVKGFNDGYIGKWVSCFNRVAERRRGKVRTPDEDKGAKGV